MTDAPEPMPEKLLIKLVDNSSSVCDGMYINAAGGKEYTLTSSVAAQLKAAYLAGFNASGEGYNGEYPYGDNNASPTTDQTWILARDAALSKITPTPE